MKRIEHPRVTVTDGTTIDLTLAGQNLTAETIDSAIDHDGLLNFVSNKHIDWTSASNNFSTSGMGHFGDDLDTDGDFTVDGEINGSKVLLHFGQNANSNAAAGSSTFLFTERNVQMTATKGLVPPRAGSIAGLTLNYDVLATPIGTVNIEVLVEGVVVWTNAISSTTANDKVEVFTQARNTDQFSAGDRIAIRISNTGINPFTYRRMIGTIELILDA